MHTHIESHPETHLVFTHFYTDVLLNFVDEMDILWRCERYGHTSRACTSGSSNSMDIELRIIRNIVVDNQLNSWNIKTTSCNVRG